MAILQGMAFLFQVDERSAISNAVIFSEITQYLLDSYHGGLPQGSPVRLNNG